MLRLALQHSEAIRNIVLIAPLGLNAFNYGSTPTSRLKELRKRTRVTFKDPAVSWLRDTRNAHIILKLVSGVLSEKRLGASGRKYASGLSYDSREDLRAVADQLQHNGRHVHLILGEKDAVFPPKEIIASLHEANIDNIPIKTIPNSPHVSLALRSSQRLLQLSIDTVRTDNS